MTISRRVSLALILLSSAISVVWGFSLGQTGNGWVDFRAVYYGTRCLIEHRDPYKVRDLENVYLAEKGAPPYETMQAHQAVTLYVNVPTTFVLVAPFAVLPWGPAHLLWIMGIAGVFILAAILMWDIGARYAPKISLILVCILLANCESLFVAGNTAGIVVGLCGVAVWCFVEQRFELAGAVCLGLSLAMKPHDGGLVWLCFLLRGGGYRKRALQSLLVTGAVGIVALLWVSHVAPHWMQEWQSNLATISQPGGINEPGPSAVTGRSAAMVVDLQAALSIFRDDAHFYNLISYLFCGTLLLLWAVRTLKQSGPGEFSAASSVQGSRSRLEIWVALAAVTALTLLVTYHRPWDAKLVMLMIPGCAMLWARGGRAARGAVAVTGAAIVLTGDIPLVVLVKIADLLHANTSSVAKKILTVVLTRPASLILVATALFYLWVYLRSGPGKQIPVSSVEEKILG